MKFLLSFVPGISAIDYASTVAENTDSKQEPVWLGMGH